MVLGTLAAAGVYMKLFWTDPGMLGAFASMLGIIFGIGGLVLAGAGVGFGLYYLYTGKK